MLKEFKKVRQEKGLKRRLFCDNLFDLYLWYREGSAHFIGFQLLFCVDDNKMALTAEVGKVPEINLVESGDGEFYSPTDILDGSGFFPKSELLKEFTLRSEAVDSLIRKNIIEVIKSYKHSTAGQHLSEIY